MLGPRGRGDVEMVCVVYERVRIFRPVFGVRRGVGRGGGGGRGGRRRGGRGI